MKKIMKDQPKNSESRKKRYARRCPYCKQKVLHRVLGTGKHFDLDLPEMIFNLDKCLVLGYEIHDCEGKK